MRISINNLPDCSMYDVGAVAQDQYGGLIIYFAHPMDKQYRIRSERFELKDIKYVTQDEPAVSNVDKAIVNSLKEILDDYFEEYNAGEKASTMKQESISFI